MTACRCVVASSFAMIEAYSRNYSANAMTRVARFETSVPAGSAEPGGSHGRLREHITDMTLEEKELGLTSDDPYPGYRWLRANKPVFWSESSEAWVISRYDDVAMVLKDHETFRQVQYSNAPVFAPADGMIDTAGGELLVVERDEPEHMLMRRIFTARGVFSRASIEARVGSHLDRVAREAVDALADGHSFDTVVSFAPAVGEMVAMFLGLPGPNECDFDWKAAVTGDYPSPSRPAYSDEIAFLRSTLERCRRGGGGDPISGFVRANEVAGAMTEGELVANVWGMAMEGGHLIMSQLSTSLHALTSMPAATTRASFLDPARTTIAIEGLIRFASPQHLLQRVATRDANVAGVRIQKGDMICTMLASGNRDETRWNDADRLDLSRTGGPPVLSFGAGGHASPGGTVARIAVTAFLRALYGRFRALRLAGEYQQQVVPMEGVLFSITPTSLPLLGTG